MTPAELIRDINARSAALRTYARAFDEWSNEQQVLMAEGKPVEAEGAGVFASLAKRAYVVESRDPEPKSVEQRYHDDREGAWPE